MEDSFGYGEQLVDGRLEELVSGVGLEDVHQRLAAVARRRVAGPLDKGAGLVGQHGDAGQALGVGRRAEQAEEPAFPDDLPVVAEGLEPDVVEVRRAVHRAARVRLGDDHQLLLAGFCAHCRWQLPERRRHDLVRAKYSEPGARHGSQHVLTIHLLELVLAVAEKREVVSGEPREQRLSLVDLAVRKRGR